MKLFVVKFIFYFVKGYIQMTISCPERLEYIIHWYTVPSSYNCTHVCDFSHGTTRFYSVSKVQIHALLRPTATRGSQCGYKYSTITCE